MSIEINSLCQILKYYDVIICDIWGVIHNGQKLFHRSIDALKTASNNGIKIILLTNSPRTSPSVIAHMRSLGLCNNFWDEIITSGDLNCHLIKEAPQNIFFIGNEIDRVLFERINIKIVEEQDAEAILCSGLYNANKEKPEDYISLLKRFAQRRIPFICANPDILANSGNKIIPCAGALALIYQNMDGIVKMVGKPHYPIYDMAFKKISYLCDSLDKKRILVIGDGINTDIKGALQCGLDALYVGEGIHIHEYLENNAINPQMVQNFFIKKKLHPRWWIKQLI
ncbi:MAG: TIGR01459 family HAD-type hydrolase [Candidatus Liberibacter europaeus]|uniref:TIGR01459 family HAD-type hydrolase n=1 Tax=Candidatus Liberibacter europaeus TaxID=744859 RepID=A0A2T4VXB4_9HYPH|nr:TIGR01459 family HAD-type hydrolase [Candidatus Liberibacter europaeus]PTL86423.1 MAG: TIGR01459 family HAD-type hydrolase [Candidatus Liberibacter europaeus]